LIDRFFSFDIDRYIEGKAAKEGRDPKEVLDEFLLLRDEAAEKGTAMHENIEHYLLGKSHSTVSKEFDLFTKFYQEIILKFGFEFYEAEKRILLEEFNIAGTVDAIFKKPNSDEYILLDWKRSKKLVVDGHPRKFGYGFALSELQHLDNSSYYKYALQQNIYKYILERNYGLKISSMNLIVLHENYNNYYRVDLPNLQREIMIIFNSINHKI
jgi:ATP-dependent exoDNAse (exonuclease V) beta subunit